MWLASRLSRRRFLSVASFSVVGTTVLAACSGTSAPPTAAPSGPAVTPAAAVSTTAPTAAPTAAAAATVAPAPTVAPTTAPATMAPATPTPAVSAQANLASDQTLRIVGFGNPTTLEPAMEGGTLRVMTQNAFRPPFVLDEKGELLPGVCTKWEVSDDGLKYLLHVDPAAKFSDGSPVTAADLKFSWERVTDPETKTWTAPYLTAPVVGYQDVVDGKTKDLKGLVVLDNQTLEITLVKPYTPFIKNLATYIAGVISKKSDVKTDGWEAKALCAGPYRIDSWNRDSGEVNWVPNQYWWGEKPIIQKVNYRYVKDQNTASIMYDNNEMDVLMPTDIISTQMLQGPHAKELHQIPYGGEVYYLFRTDLKPTSDPNVRLALLKATDMGSIVQAVFQGGKHPAYGIISPNLDCYPNRKSYFDPAGARAALGASTYKSGANLPPITIAVPTNTTEYIRTSEAMQQMWKQNLGVDVTIHQMDKATDPIRSSAQILRVSLGTIVNDPSAAASAMGLSEYQKVDTGYGGGYNNPAVEGLLNKADSLPLSGEPARCKLYQQAEDIMMTEDAPYIPIIWVEYYFAVKPWVMNYVSNNDNSLYNIPRMYLTKH
jgi:ABC-type oligopeptide transport system substrate-binding subunit